MNIYECIILLLGGVGVFIEGMNILSQNLQKVAVNSLKKLLAKISGNRFFGVGIGALVTAIIQSSAATTVMVIGLVNAETLNLHQATPIIMGANIGTTISGLMASLDSLNVSLYLSLLVFIGAIMTFFKKDLVKTIGKIVLGTGLIFVGLSIMSNACKEEALKSVLKKVFESISFPLLQILVGAVLTALVQSSTATTGVIIVLVDKDILDLGDALFLILGSNIGTCVTALISAIGQSTNSLRTAIIHLLFNVIGSIFFTIVIWSLRKYVIKALKMIVDKPGMQIAWFHFFFNVITTILLLPCVSLIVKLACLLVKEKEKKETGATTNLKFVKQMKFLNKRFLLFPQIAIIQAKKEIKYMSLLAKTNLEKALKELYDQSEKYTEEISSREELIDFLNIEVTKYLIKLSPLIDEKQAEEVAIYYHLLNDIERIGDHAKAIMEDATQMKQQKIHFCTDAIQDMKESYEIISKMFNLSIESFDSVTERDFAEIEDLRDKLGSLQNEGSKNHFSRLTQGKTSMELSNYFSAVFAHFSSIGDHLNNITHSFKKNLVNNSVYGNKELDKDDTIAGGKFKRSKTAENIIITSEKDEFKNI